MNYQVKLTYNAYKIYDIEAKSMEVAHKKAYNTFMDSHMSEILEDSTVDVIDFGVETNILGEKGTDMLHL